MRAKSSMLNILFSLLYKISTMILGFIVAKLILTTYGSAMNGMLASIKQFISYLALVEMGIAGASIYALYKPLAEKNDIEISKILSEAKSYYFKSGILFTIGCVILSVIYSAITYTGEVSYWLIFVIFLILSVSTAMDFFAFAKYRVIFTADQKEYIINICNTIHVFTYSILSIMVIKANLSIIIMQATIIIAYFTRSLVLYIFYKKIYANRFKITSQKIDKVVKQKGSVMCHEIAWLILSSTPVIFMTLFYSLEKISVYSVYNMVINNIVLVIAIFNSSFTSSFGQILSEKNNTLFNKIYNEFECMYFSLTSFLFLCTIQLIQPFVDIYTLGIEDIDYNNKLLMTLMIVLAASNCFRVPSSIIIGISGRYKSTVKSTILSIIICIGISFIGALFSFEFILLGSIVAYIFRAIIFMIEAGKINIGYKISKSVKNIIVSVAIFFIAYNITNNLIQDNISNYFQWIRNAFMIVACNGIIYIALMFTLNKDPLIGVINRIKAMRKRVLA